MGTAGVGRRDRLEEGDADCARGAAECASRGAVPWAAAKCGKRWECRKGRAGVGPGMSCVSPVATLRRTYLGVSHVQPSGSGLPSKKRAYGGAAPAPLVR